MLEKHLILEYVVAAWLVVSPLLLKTPDSESRYLD
jgi:hypothetical protein